MLPRANGDTHKALYAVAVAISETLAEAGGTNEPAWVDINVVYDCTTSLWEDRTDFFLTLDAAADHGEAYIARQITPGTKLQYSLTAAGREFISRHGPPRSSKNKDGWKYKDEAIRGAQPPLVTGESSNQSKGTVHSSPPSDVGDKLTIKYYDDILDREEEATFVIRDRSPSEIIGEHSNGAVLQVDLTSGAVRFGQTTAGVLTAISDSTDAPLYDPPEPPDESDRKAKAKRPINKKLQQSKGVSQAANASTQDDDFANAKNRSRATLAEFVDFDSLTVLQGPTLEDVSPAGLAVVLKIEDPSRNNAEIVELMQLEYGIHYEPTAINSALKEYLTKQQRNRLEEEVRTLRARQAAEETTSGAKPGKLGSAQKTTYRELSEVPYQQLSDAVEILGITVEEDSERQIIEQLADHGIQARNYGGGATPVIKIDGQWIDVRQIDPSISLSDLRTQSSDDTDDTDDTAHSSDGEIGSVEAITTTLDGIIESADEPLHPNTAVSEALDKLAKDGSEDALQLLIAVLEEFYVDSTLLEQQTD